MRIRYNAAAAIALNSQRIQASSLAKSLEKLSTGLRINRASDDAAGLSISEKLRTQVRGSEQAIRNVQNANSIFDIEEGVLGSMESMLQRMRELSLQAMNDTLTDTERGLINIEVAALVDEIGRLSMQRPYLNSFQMDGTFAPYARTTNTANEAIASEGSVTVIGATTTEDYFGIELVAEVIQVAENQELDDVSQTSTHIQETLGPGIVAFQNNILIAGTASGTRGDDLINLTAGAEPVTAGSTGALERQTDLTDIDPNYTIVGGGPISAGAGFQLQVGSQDLLGTLYQVTGEAATTNAAGLTNVLNLANGTDVDNITRVQTDRYVERFMADANGSVLLGIAPPSMDEVRVRNNSDYFANSATGVESSSVGLAEFNGSQVVFSDSQARRFAANPDDMVTLVPPNAGPADIDLVQVDRGGGLETATFWDGISVEPVGSLRWRDLGGGVLEVGEIDGSGTNIVTAPGPNDIWVEWQTATMNQVSTISAAAVGEMAYALAGDTITVGRKNAALGLDVVANQEIAYSYSTNSWRTLNDFATAGTGETTYTLVGNNLTVGVKEGAGLLDGGTYDISARYTDAGNMQDVLELGVAAAGDMAYSVDFISNDNRITVGVEEDGVVDGIAIGGNLDIDFQAVEDDYDFTYSTNRFFEVPGAGAATIGGVIQFAEDLYDGAGNIGADLDGNRKLEVRINGVVTTNFRFHDTLGAFNNVIEFGFTPLGTDVITVDYTTAAQTAVDWTNATIGENSTADGNVTAGEAAARTGAFAGVFNDFWDGQSANTITVTQANRPGSPSMTLTVDPDWTVQQFIDGFNAQAEIDDVEAEAFFNIADNEVQLRPGTSGWKDRPITGWGGGYFDLSGPSINAGTVIGPGSSGDDAANQNTYQLNQSQASTDSIIRLSTEEGTVLGVSTSNWNEHTFAGIGLVVRIQDTAQVGDTSQFLLSASQLLAGPNANFADVIYFHIPDVSPDVLGIDNINVNDRPSAVLAMSNIDNAIDIITNRRVYFGTKINQNNHIINNLHNNAINTQYSEQQIRDTDFALQTTQFAKSQILMQSTQAVLAQANSAQVNVLGLINSMTQPGSS